MNSLEVAFPVTGESAETCIKAVQPETDSQPGERIKSRLSNKAGLKLLIEAGDLTALRAALNTQLRLIDTSLKMIITE